MALYTPNSFSRRKGGTRLWIYIISAVLIIGVVVVFKYGSYPFGRGEVDVGGSANEGPGPGGAVPAPDPDPEPVAEEVEVTPTPEVAPEPEVVVEPKPGPVVVTPSAADRTNPEVTDLINKALMLINESPSRIIEARTVLNEALPNPMSREQRDFIKKQLSWLADKWLFSRSVFPEDHLCGSYKVQPGDYLQSIGNKFKVPHEMLQEINNITRPEALQAGKTIKVINGPFNAKVYRSTFTMDLYLQNTFVRSFSVGLGKPGRETPTGWWCVEPGGKMVSPSWTDPDTGKLYRPSDPDYPLGSRWIGLKGLEGDAKGRTGIAFHGMKDPDLMAGGGSRGCIRLSDGDALLVYNLMVPTYSKVQVLE